MLEVRGLFYFDIVEGTINKYESYISAIREDFAFIFASGSGDAGHYGSGGATVCIRYSGFPCYAAGYNNLFCSDGIRSKIRCVTVCQMRQGAPAGFCEVVRHCPGRLVLASFGCVPYACKGGLGCGEVGLDMEVAWGVERSPDAAAGGWGVLGAGAFAEK